MSNTFHLVCDETKKRIWIGQGWAEMTNFYTDEHETMERLRRFFNDHPSPKTLRFVSEFDDRLYDYDQYK